MTALLVVIYNHHYPKNINRIEDIYHGRFSKILHIMPFYEGNKHNVFAVYENSFMFQGYIAQASLRILSEYFDHAIFIGDDLLLNPQINEENYHVFFGIGPQAGFIPNFIDLSTLTKYWARARESLNWRANTPGVEVKEFMPPIELARNRLAGHGIAYRPISVRAISRNKFVTKIMWRPIDFARTFFDPISHYTSKFDDYNWPIRGLLRRLYRHLPRAIPEFPIVGSYSDIFIIPKDSFKAFVQLSGIFAAQGLHVELAVPTALLNTVSDLSTEKNLEYSGRAYWGSEVSLIDSLGNTLKDLETNFPKKQLYIHPVKLSKWMKP